MSTPFVAAVGDFLHAFGQALAAMSLYGASHPSRRAARERARGKLRVVLSTHAALRITCLDGDVIADRSVLHDFLGWEWGRRLSAAGIQRLEFDVGADDEGVFSSCLDRVHAAVGSGGTPVREPVVLGPIRLGPVGLAKDGRTTPAVAADAVNASAGTTEAVPLGHRLDEAALPPLSGTWSHGTDDPNALRDERDALTWVQSQVAAGNRIPVGEVEAVVRGLSQAMQAEHGALLPLIALKNADEYTTVHACNVAMLAMGLAEQLAFGARDVRAIGVAALLHDIGKIRLSAMLLNKPGHLTEAERALMQSHTVEGARLLGERGAGYGLASIVAYEHHVWANGAGGYPTFIFPRPPHYVTRLVQVCDVYDALCTARPYRPAWPRARTLHHMRLQAGKELDYDLLLGFFDLIGRSEKRQLLPL
jgi:putative nucleotidyltransferase with HDIG domain